MYDQRRRKNFEGGQVFKKGHFCGYKSALKLSENQNKSLQRRFVVNDLKIVKSWSHSQSFLSDALQEKSSE